MPGLVAAEVMEEHQEQQQQQQQQGAKSEIETGNGNGNGNVASSPRSPLSPPPGKQNSAEIAEQVNPSIEQLYENVRQMKSPGDRSLSQRSSAEQSEVEDQRIDSELHKLAAAGSAEDNDNDGNKTNNNNKAMEKSATPVHKSAEKSSKPKETKPSPSSAKSVGKAVSSDKNPGRSSKPVSINQPKKPPKLVVSSDGPAKTSPSPNKGGGGGPRSVSQTPTKVSSAKSKAQLDNNSHRNDVTPNPPKSSTPSAAAAAAADGNSSGKSNANHVPAERNSHNHRESGSPVTQKKLFSTPDKTPRRSSLSPVPKHRLSSPAVIKMQKEADEISEAALDNPDLGPFLLKLARTMITSGDNPHKALEHATRASKSFEICAEGKPSLEFVMSLHILAAIHCSLSQYDQAIPVLERSIEVPVLEEGPEHALAAFAGRMQLGDTYAMLGQLENSIECYKSGLEIQKQILGDMDPRVGETCRYLAEAHVQAMQFDEAEKLCQHALDIHKEHSPPASPEEVADRRLMALICDGKGDYEAALEHLVLASVSMVSNGQEAEVASVDCSIGDTYLALGRYDEAVFAYQKSLTAFKSTKGENHPSVAAVYVRLADLYYKTGKIRESKSYCENALRIYNKPSPLHSIEDIASGLTELAAIYEAMNEAEQALRLLQKSLKILNDSPGQQSAIAGIEAQMGVIYYVLGRYAEAYASFKSAVSKLRASGECKSSFFAIVLNQMGLACVQRYAINEAADLFEESRSILDEICGSFHPDTLAVYSNLAGTYDAMGRLEDAITMLEHVVRTREEKLGTANPDVDDEKRRLAELYKEAGRARKKKAKSLETLLDSNMQRKKKDKSN